MALTDVELNLGNGGAKIGVDGIGGVDYEVVKQAFGDAGALTLVSSTNPLPVSATIDTTGLATSGKQDTGNTSLGSIDTKTPALGQALSAASTPVVLPASQITTLTPPAAITNYANETGGHLASLDTKLPAQGQALSAASLPVVLPAAQVTTLTPPAAITNYANETGGNLAAIKTDVDKIPSQGQAAMAASMPVVISSNQSAIPVTLSGAATDNIQLLSSTINAAGAITGIDTTGYLSIVTQFTGTWVGAMVFEGSNDNSNWVQLLALNTDDLSMQDAIYDNGVFVLKTSTKFIRINVFQLQSGSITVLMLGRSVSGINASDLLSLAFDNANGLSLNVSETQTKKDITKALIPSDAPAPIYGNANVVNGILSIIDTTGYQSLTVETSGTWSATVTVSCSNDGNTWNGLLGYNTLGASAGLSTFNINGQYVFPALGRFIRLQITAYTSGNVQTISYLRQQPISTLTNQNLSLISGNAVITAGVGGMLAIGGNIANGIAPTANPILTAGIDTSGLTRRILTDTSGRLIQAVTDAAGTVRALGALPPASNSHNVTSLPVSDVTQFEGQSQIELLAQILLELRIVTQQLKELPITLMGTTGAMDEPSQFRSEQSLFAI